MGNDDGKVVHVRSMVDKQGLKLRNATKENEIEIYLSQIVNY